MSHRVRREFVVVLLGLGAASPLAGQSRVYTIPEAFHGSFAAGGSYFPFARTRGLIQTWYSGSQIPRGLKTMKEIGWRQDAWTKTGATTHRAEIKLENTKIGFTGLQATFAKNLVSPTTFFSMKTISLPALGAPVDPDKPAAWIKGDRPFTYTGPNLLVQVDVRTKTTYASVPGLGFNSFAMGRRPMHWISHRSCGGKLAGIDAGPYWQIDLSGVKPKSPAALLVGLRLLPVDLGSLFGRGCRAVVEPLLVIPTATDALGKARFLLPYAPAPAALVAHAQVLHRGATSTGWATTNAVHSILSWNGVSTYLYNWSRDGSIAESGPFPTNRGTVLLVK